MIPIDACEPYFEYVRKYTELDAEAMQLIASQISEVTFPKKHIILPENSACNKVYFIVSGTARSYYTDFSGITVTWSFHFNNSRSVIRNVFAVDYRAFITNKPSSISIETLSEVKAFVFTKEAVSSMMERSLKYEIWMRKLNENAYVSMFDRAFTLLTMSATERYSKLVEEEPHLLQMFSNHYIASYLGIAPQSLSRIRSQH
ncbi:Crp/Fnr family transcriptional regulator [Danxiaibacter flavus]|uniref:Crp/Fnr family transcriptional regulator n=1 Tax=Danxiaibacter flavus TaxID=3049108 RepID=A0ABV3ZJ30_9BACT|nr:Crp/Fnr family transcriptional regulator [Chitinophagaceae bacterium DXS]